MHNKPLFPRGLYGVTPEWDDTPRLLDAIRAAHAGGMQVLQWRRKLSPANSSLHQTQRQAVIDVCQELDLPLLINDNWQLARDLTVAGAHMGRDDGALHEAKAGLAATQWLGCSCYDQIELARQGIALGVNYVAFGAAYPSTIKPNAPRATLDIFRQARQLCEQHATAAGRVAVVAIGGITASNAAPLIDAGVDSIAAISSLFEAPDVYTEAMAFSQLFN